MSGATGVAQTNAGLEKMVAELRQELHQMRMPRLRGQRNVPTLHSASLTPQSSVPTTAQYAAHTAEQRAVAAHNDADAAQGRSNSCWSKSCEMLTWHFKKKGRFTHPR